MTSQPEETVPEAEPGAKPDCKADDGDAPAMSDALLEGLRQQRFRQRVDRVVAVMNEERIDWRGVPFIGPDGRIGVRVHPVEMGSS